MEKIFSPQFPHQKWVEMISQIFIKISKVSKIKYGEWGNEKKE